MKMSLQTALARLRARLRGGLRGHFGDHASALAACKDGAYEGRLLVDSIASKTSAYRASLGDSPRTPSLSDADSRILLALASCGAGIRPVSVIDLGGACGAHYYQAVRFFGREVPLDWRIVETPAMVRAAVASGLDDQVHFHPTVEDAATQGGPADLVLCSGALQYLPHPQEGLQQLMHLAGRCVCIARVPVALAGELFYCAQTTLLSENGPGSLPPGVQDRSVTYPMAVIPAGLIESAFTRSEFRIFVLNDAGCLHHADGGYLSFRTYLAMRA